MEYRRLGSSGLKVSLLGVGGNTFGRYTDPAQTARILHRAIDIGVNFVDTADVYNNGLSEEHVGAALRGRRSDMVIATKLCGPMGTGPNDRGVSRQHVMDSVENSLRRLQTEYIDLYQIHNWDPETPLEESLRALDDLVRAGKVRYVGCSNFSGWQMVQALWVADRRGFAPIVSNQPQYSLIERDIERELIPASVSHGIGLIPYAPLAGGLLTGKYREGEAAPAGTRGADNERLQQRFTPRAFGIVRRLVEWSEAHGRQPAEVALGWIAAQPAISTIIVGARHPEQVETNAKLLEWRPTPDEAKEISALSA